MGDWNLLELWRSMGTLCHGVVIVLAIMFVRSVSVASGRALRYRLAREQSETYIAETIVPLRDGHLDEAIVLAEHNKKSHIASVVAAGLLDFHAAPTGMPEQQVIASGGSTQGFASANYFRLRNSLASRSSARSAVGRGQLASSLM
jgi:biopolymer transport protein ExbB/biopolymer transport protein TolQ